MAQQTAVEWLWDKIDNLIPYQDINQAQQFNGLLEQAKEMEKEQKLDINRVEVFEEYMRRVNAIADDCDWVTHIGPETLVNIVIDIIENDTHLSAE